MRKYIIAIIILLPLLIWAGLRLLPGDAGRTGEAAPITATVVMGDLESVVTAQGKLEPKNYVDVGAQVSGMIRKLHADIGDVVNEGDLIAEIDPDIYEAQVRGDEARLKTLQAQKAEQEALVEQAQQKFERNENLIKDRAISREILEDSKTALNVARARLLSLEAQIEQAQSSLEGNIANLNYTRIFAPMNGTVVSHSVKEGQTINANQTAPVIVQIADLDTMTVRAQVAEADVMKLSPDMAMYFTTLGSQNRKWQGRIRQILPTPETLNDVVLYNVLVDVDNKDRQLMSGMTTQMFFVLDHVENAPLIPISALQKRVPDADTDTARAYQIRVMRPRGGDEMRTVLIRMTDRTRAAVESGLNEGESVIIQSPTPSTNTQGGGRMRMPRL